MRILVITAHYPAYDIPDRKGRTTPFLQQYTSEWVKNGNQVRIIHLMRSYPPVFYIGSKILSKVGIKNFEKYSVSKLEIEENEYEYEGVSVMRKIYKKLIPHSKTSSFEIKRLQKVVSIEISNFSPNIIIGDCFDPVLQVYSHIKSKPFVQIVHNSDFNMLKYKAVLEGARAVDKWLFRSSSQVSILAKLLGEPVNNYSYIYSGIETSRITEDVKERDKIEKLIYVGALMKSKGLDTILQALDASMNKNLHLNVFGEGVDRDFFEKRVLSLNLEKRVNFYGAIPHDEVFSKMKDADALVLISHETFGMVYVEAMSQGCIPIGAKNEGIDGVVVNEENGFLTELGDVDELTILFNSFMSMENDTIAEISHNAYQTAVKMTNQKLAFELLQQFYKA